METVDDKKKITAHLFSGLIWWSETAGKSLVHQRMFTDRGCALLREERRGWESRHCTDGASHLTQHFL